MGSSAVLQHRKWIGLFSGGDSMWCLFLENIECENWGEKYNMGFNMSNTDIIFTYIFLGAVSLNVLCKPRPVHTKTKDPNSYVPLKTG